MIASVSPEADRELSDGALYYAREAGSEVALAFIMEYERALDLLCRNPNLGPIWRKSRHRFPLRKFPYSIIYYLDGEDLRVIALAHHRRMPTYWGRRK